MRLAPEPAWPAIPDETAPISVEPAAFDAVTEVLLLGASPEGFEAAVGARFPRAGECTEAGDVRALWWGRDAALVLGAAVDVPGAVCVDQTDGYAGLVLSGAVRDVLARLCPLDLRDSAFGVGSTARSLVKHVDASLTRIAPETWLLLVPRSMSATVLEDLIEAAAGVAGADVSCGAGQGCGRGG